MLPLLMLVLAAAAIAPAASQEAVPAAQYGPPANVAPAYPAAAPEAVGVADVAGLDETAGYYPAAYSYNEPGFSVQTGYEGYLVPYQGHSVSAPAALGGLGLLGSLLPLPKLGLKLFPKVGLFLLGFLFLLLVGGAFTTAVCAFTPFCTISFLGLGLTGLTRNSMRAYLTPDRLTQTTAFVLDAIDKYQDFSKKVSKKEARNAARSNTDVRRRR